jgi:hypothetical protein
MMVPVALKLSTIRYQRNFFRDEITGTKVTNTKAALVAILDKYVGFRDDDDNNNNNNNDSNNNNNNFCDT